jgi:hypothetical protein
MSETKFIVDTQYGSCKIAEVEVQKTTAKTVSLKLVRMVYPADQFYRLYLSARTSKDAYTFFDTAYAALMDGADSLYRKASAARDQAEKFAAAARDLQNAALETVFDHDEDGAECLN